MNGVLTFWALWNAVILTTALACLVYDHRDDPDQHRFHLEDS